MALAGALCACLLAVTGITNRSLRARVAELLGVDYNSAQMSYDLRRLRMKGLITRLPGTNTYTLTPDGQRIAIFYTKLHDRLLRPLTAADRIPAPLPLRQALRSGSSRTPEGRSSSTIIRRRRHQSGCGN